MAAGELRPRTLQTRCETQYNHRAFFVICLMICETQLWFICMGTFEDRVSSIMADGVCMDIVSMLERSQLRKLRCTACSSKWRDSPIHVNRLQPILNTRSTCAHRTSFTARRSPAVNMLQAAPKGLALLSSPTVPIPRVLVQLYQNIFPFGT